MLKKEIRLARTLLREAKARGDDKTAVALMDLIRKLEISQAELRKLTAERERIEIVVVPALLAGQEEGCE